MSDCEKLKNCPFFNDEMLGYPESTEVLKSRYCKGDKTECARYIVATELGKEHVPGDLYPYDRSKVKLIIDNARKVKK